MADFVTRLKAEGINIGSGELEQFEMYHAFLIQENRITNLTRITEKQAVFNRHFLDSLSLRLAFPIKDQTLLDVGSGAGFPSLPLKIVFPELKVTIVDSLGKRIRFLESLTKLLELADVDLVNCRIEDYDRKAAFDIVTARALAKLNILVELCLPFVRIGGYLVAMKAIDYETELEAAMNGIAKLGGRFERAITYEVEPGLDRALLLIRKIGICENTYPRSFAKIKKNPL